jgi:signal transduction histidine kinase/CheY-like chemotaxis protein
VATVLVVDDQPTNRAFLVTLLGYAGHHLLEAADGAEALEVVRAERPDLVIADLVMPTMDGYEFVRQLRADPALAQTRVMFWTATYLQAEAYALAQACGVHHIITKPAEPEAVLTSVAGALALAPVLPQPFSSEEFHQEHLRVLTDKLSKQVQALEQEVAERRQAEAAREAEAQIATALARVGRELISSLEAPVLLERLCQLTAAVLATESSHTLLWQPEEAVYVPVSGYGDTPEQAALTGVLQIPSASLAGVLAYLERDEVVEVEARVPQSLVPVELARPYGITRGLFMALRRGGEVVGIQTAAYRGRTVPFTMQQKRIAQGIAQLASLALQNARLLERAESASRLKSDFLATISHELRTPLNIIMGYTDLLLDEDLGPLAAEQSKALQAVRRAAHDEFEVVTSVLDVSRLEAGQAPVMITEVEVAELVEEIKEETERRGTKPSLTWQWRVAPEVPRIRTDRLKLKLVLQNLLNNALKFTDQGGVTVEVRPHEAGVDWQVSDTGVGIAPEVLPIIFDMFRQGNQSATRLYGGLGLGLYIVRRMVELLGGTIRVESVVGRGSTFWVWIPTDWRPAAR